MCDMSLPLTGHAKITFTLSLTVTDLSLTAMSVVDN